MFNDQADELRHLVHHATVGDIAAWKRPRLVVVLGAKGGVGSTTVAVRLATALAEAKRRTALIDANPRGGDVAAMCRLKDDKTMLDVLDGKRNVRAALCEGPGGMRVLPGGWVRPDRPPTEADYARVVRQVLDLGHGVDIAVVDVGSSVSPSVAAFARQADALLLASTPDATAVMNAYAMLKAIHGEIGHAAIHLVVTRTDDAATVRDIRDRLARAAHRFLALRIQTAFGVGDPASADMRAVVEALDGAPKVAVRIENAIGA